jgi:hypothetical protein
MSHDEIEHVVVVKIDVVFDVLPNRPYLDCSDTVDAING